MSVAVALEATQARMRQWLTVSLSVWAVGVLTVEPLAVAGMSGSVLGVLVFRGVPSKGDVRGFAASWWPVLLFVAWALVVPSLAGHPPSGTGLARTADWLGVPVAATAWSALDPRGRQKVIAAAAVTFVISCAVAGLQHFGAWPSPSFFDPVRFTRIPFDRVYEPIPGTEGRFMGGGLVFHRLKFAHVGGLLVLGAVVVSLRARGWMRVGAAAVAVFGLVAIALFPHARAGIGTLLVACVVAGVLAHRRRRQALAVAVIAAVAAAAALATVPSARQRLVSSVTSRGSGDRALLLKAGLDVIRAQPIAGIGAGRFRAMDHVAADAPDHVRSHAGKAHNQLVSLAAEIGIPGALLFLAVLVALARRMSAASASGAFGLAALAFFVLLSLVHDPLFHPQFSLALVAALGVGCAREPPAESAGT